MTEMVAREPVEDTTRVCPTCRDTGLVEAWQPHDGSDYPDKRGHLERRLVPCPDCRTRNQA